MKTAFAAAAMPHPHPQVLGACRAGPHDPVNGQTQRGQRCQSLCFLWSLLQTDPLCIAVGARTRPWLMSSE